MSRPKWVRIKLGCLVAFEFILFVFVGRRLCGCRRSEVGMWICTGCIRWWWPGVGRRVKVNFHGEEKDPTEEGNDK